MKPRRSARLVVLTVVPALSLAALGCKRGDAGAADAAAGEPSYVLPPPSIRPPPPPPPSATSRLVELGQIDPSTLPVRDQQQPSWNGYYKCKDRLSITHAENTVTGRMTGDAETKTFVCTLAPSGVCTGTETTMAGREKAGAAERTHKLTVRRDSNGTLHYTGASSMTCSKL